MVWMRENQQKGGHTWSKLYFFVDINQREIKMPIQMKATNVVKHSNIVDREKRSEALGTGQ